MSERSLEELLHLAAEQEEYRIAFYQKLLETNVFVLGGEGAQEGEVADGELSLVEWEDDNGFRGVPFFTSYGMLQEAVGEDYLYLELNCAVLFASLDGANAVMNPGFSDSKYFPADEIELVLTTEFDELTEDDEDDMPEFSEDVAIRPITKNRSVAMLKTIKAYLLKHPEVKRAYVAAMNEVANEDESHLVIGIEMDGEHQKLFQDIMNIVLKKGPDDEIVDLFRIDPTQKEGMSAYFIHEMKPFYIKGISKNPRRS